MAYFSRVQQILAVLSVMFCISIAASANTLQTVKANFFLVSDGTATVNFAQFNPALGTLTGVEVESTNAILSAGAEISDPCPAGITASQTTTATGSVVGHVVGSTSATASCPGNGSAFNQINTPFDISIAGPLTSFEGNGTVGLHFQLGLQGGGPGNIFTGDAFLVYTYTPASSTVPEPASLVLLASGLAGFFGVIRRRLT